MRGGRLHHARKAFQKIPKGFFEQWSEQGEIHFNQEREGKRKK
jgi:hypothetical protein